MTEQREQPQELALWRVGATVAVLAFAYAIILSFVPWAYVGMAFAFPVGIIYPVLLVAGMLVVGVITLWVGTGQRRVVAATLSSLAGLALTTALVFRAGTIPVWWTGVLDLAPVLAGVVAALTAVLFLPVGWARAIGGLALAAALAIIVVPPALVGIQQQREDAAQAQEDSEAALDVRVATATLPAITEGDGSRIWDVQPTEYVSIVWAISAENSAMRIDTVGPSTDSGRKELACWMLVQDVGSFDESVTMEQYAGVCEEVAPGRWEETDGTGIALLVDDQLVLLRIPDQDTAEAIGAERGATTPELSDAAGRLRIISREELREYLLVSPVDSEGRS
jgi:hypothetical protein